MKKSVISTKIVDTSNRQKIINSQSLMVLKFYLVFNCEYFEKI